jgi:hypothetical protein
MGGSLRNLCLALVVALLAVVPAALAAEEPTRDEYVRTVDLICKKNEKANSRILEGVEAQIKKKHQLVPAGNRFLRASTSFGRAVGEIVRVPQPAADKPKLGQWIGQLHLEQSLLRNIGKALKSEKTGRANHLAVSLKNANQRANNIVFSFQFRYCDRQIKIG